MQDSRWHLQNRAINSFTEMQDTNEFELYKGKEDSLKITEEGVSFDRFNGLEGVELHKSLNLKPQTQANASLNRKQKGGSISGGYHCDRTTGLRLNLGILTRSPLAAQTVPRLGQRLKQSGSKFDYIAQ